ncbi:SNF2 family N-terminal domain-containing protein [Trichoderma novae-zelandiae]
MAKIKTEEDCEAEFAPGPHQNIFSRFMNQVAGSTSQESETANDTASTHGDTGTAASEDDGDIEIVAEASVRHDSPAKTRPDDYTVVKYSSKSATVVDLEDILPKEAQDIQGGDVQKADDTDLSTSIAPETQRVNDGMTPVCSSTTTADGPDDAQQSNDSARSTGELPSQKEQDDTVDRDTTGVVASDEAVAVVRSDEMQQVKLTVSSADMEPTEKTDKKMRKEHASEKKRKEKRSHKRSKSGDHHSKSSKRAKISETSAPDHERENTKTSGGQDDLAKAFDVEQARGMIPTNCSIRHEHDQQEELKGGKKLARSKNHTKFMATTLKEHQLTALSWMVKREKEVPRPAAGGIIGDEMGLGKTVTSLACIATHRLNKADRKKMAQATLVIVPSRKVAIQWRDEARKHWHEEASQNVIVYAAANDLETRHYEKQWIVLATYAQLRYQYPRKELMDALDRQYADDPLAHRREFRKAAKDLFRISWFRVILDEAHEISKWNGRSKFTLNPINMSDEVSLADRSSLESEAKNAAESEATNDSFDTIASYLMYRRTAGEKLDIPPTTHQEVYVEVSAEEEILCNVINAFYKRRQWEHEEGKEKKGMPVFEDEHDEDGVEDVMPVQDKSNDKGKEPTTKSIQASRQLRLRQALSHPYCLENFLMRQDYLSEGEFRSMVEDLRSTSGKRTVIEQLEADPDWQNHLGKYRTGLEILKGRKEVSLGGVFDMNNILSLLLAQHHVKRSKCGGSDGHSQDLSQFRCGHIHCSTCLSLLMMQRSNLPAEEKTGGPKCSADDCGQDLLFGQPVKTLEMMAAKAQSDKSYVEIGKDSIMTTVQPRKDPSIFFAASSYVPRIVPPPSSRLTATVAVAMTWLTEAPHDKIIIFTQFVHTLKMLGFLFQILGVKFVYYSGALPKQKQDHSMNAFQNDPRTMVMISTMKSGGQSHNLTVANRVIIVDLWWNKMAEKQAISRVARMGQTKETFSVRIVTKHSMDDRVIEVQTVKAEAVARMLQDDGHVRTDVDDEGLERMFEPKPFEPPKPMKRKGVKETVTEMMFKEETPEW